MPNVFFDRIIDFKQYDINLEDNIFSQIIETRKKKYDAKRFFLRYISSEELAKYDLNNIDSLNEFRDIRCSCLSPVKGMAGCNLMPEFLEKGIRDSGIAISDPNQQIEGQFDIMDGKMYYSPIFPYFYEERDIIKFASEYYLTTIPFDQLVLNQIKFVKEFYVHVRNPKTFKEIYQYGDYVFEEISKNQMIDYVKDPEQGQKVLKKYMDSLK